ncbi:hypothetical protein C7D73_30825, partial [Klebsiella pneumoniae]
DQYCQHYVVVFSDSSVIGFVIALYIGYSSNCRLGRRKKCQISIASIMWLYFLIRPLSAL